MGRDTATTRPTTEIGQRLFSARQAAGISASKLSEAAKVTRSVVRQIETGAIVEPSAAIVSRLARLLGTTSEWLVTGAGKGPTAAATRAAWTRTTSESAA